MARKSYQTDPLPTSALWTDWQPPSSMDGWSISIRTRTLPASLSVSDSASYALSMASRRTTSPAVPTCIRQLSDGLSAGPASPG